jgi:hypothetical protein
MVSRALARCEGPHRRDFLRIGCAGLLGISLAECLHLEARAAAPRSRRAESVIMVWLSGGPSTIDMWDLKPDAPENIRGEFRPIETAASGLRIGEPMPRLARVMDRCSLVRSLHHSITAHGPGTVYMTTGNPPSAALEYPAYGALAARLLTGTPGVPPNVGFAALREGAGGVGYLGPPYGPFEIEGDPAREELRARGVAMPDGFTLKDLEDRDGLRRRFDAGLAGLDQTEFGAGLSRFQQQALDVLRSSRVRDALDLGREPAKLRDDYGRTSLGQGALAARRLIEAGVRFVTLGFGGWDTHGNNFGLLRNRLLPTLDQSLAALIRDLESRGLLEKTIVFCAGEFGRTPQINSTAGRDHWSSAMAVLLAGGGLGRGHAYGRTDFRGMGPTEDPCSPDDLGSTIFHCLGIEPSHEITTGAGRPIMTFRQGKVLEGLLAS